MRIVIVAGKNVLPTLGGQGSFCYYLAQGLVQLGHEITIVGESGWSKSCESTGAKFVERPSPRVLKAADVVHVNGPGRRAVLLSLSQGCPVVLTHQDYSYLCPASRAWTPEGCSAGAKPGPCAHCPRQGFRAAAAVWGLRQLCRRSANVAVSHSLYERLQISHGTWILSPAVPCPGSGSENDGLLAFAGRLAPEKGVDLLLRALCQVPGARLEIAGDGPMRARLESLADSLCVANRVCFRGWLSRDGVRDLLHRATVVCVPSLWPEPFGYAAAEAMAAARPIVATDSGAFRELIGKDRGWLSSPAVSGWAAALTEVLERPSERKRRAELALRFLRSELDPVKVALRYVRVYEDAAGRQ